LNEGSDGADVTSGDSPFQTRAATTDVLKTNEGILMPIGTSGPRGKGMKRSTLGIRGQRSGSYEVEIDKFPFG